MLDVRDYCESHKLQPSPEMDLDKMKKIVEDDFGGQIGIWGSVERAPGTEGEIYDLVIKCVDFSAKPKPKVIYEVKARTKSVSEIPHLYVKADARRAVRAEAGRPGRPRSAGRRRTGRRTRTSWPAISSTAPAACPRAGTSVAGQQREPLGGLVRWTTEKGNADNKVIRFTLDRNVAENEGVMYYSDYFPVEEGAKYRFQCRWRSNGPAVKVFIKCYDDRSPRRGRAAARSIAASRTSRGRTARGTRRPRTSRRSTRSTRRKWGRVMLYAYLSPGAVEFDDVVVKQIVARLARRAGQSPPPFQRDRRSPSRRWKRTSAAAGNRRTQEKKMT